MTLEANIKRGGNAIKTYCPKGHPYSGDNLILYPDGHRICRTCHRVNDQRSKAKIRGFSEQTKLSVTNRIDMDSSK